MCTGRAPRRLEHAFKHAYRLVQRCLSCLQMRLVESFVLLVAKLHGAKNDIHKEILHHRLGGLAEITWFDSPAGQLVLGLEVVVLLVALDGFEYQDLPVLESAGRAS